MNRWLYIIYLILQKFTADKSFDKDSHTWWIVQILCCWVFFPSSIFFLYSCFRIKEAEISLWSWAGEIKKEGFKPDEIQFSRLQWYKWPLTLRLSISTKAGSFIFLFFFWIYCIKKQLNQFKQGQEFWNMQSDKEKGDLGVLVCFGVLYYWMEWANTISCLS